MACDDRPAPARSGSAPVVLVLGPEDFLAERTITEVTCGVRATDELAEVAEHDATGIGVGALAGMLAPSLFAATRVVVLRAGEASPEVGAELLGYAEAPLEDTVLVVAHPGGAKGRAWVDKLRRAPAVRTVPCDRLKPRDLPVFVTAEVRAAGGRATGDAPAALVDAVGSDLRTLAAAAAQLVADAPDARVTGAVVAEYFAGRSEVSSFAVADAALAGRTGQALERLRWALGSGVAPVLVSSALAASVRRLVKVRGLAPAVRSNDAAAQVGVPPWKLDQLRREARDWSSHGLAESVQAVANADADVKGAAVDPAYALERAVLSISSARGRDR